MTGPPADRVGARPPALDDDAVERLLAGDLDPASAPPGYGEVAALLAATLAEPSPDELAGQAAAVAELRAMVRARPAGNRPAGRPRRRTVLLAVAAVLGALSTGGVAAATDHVPQPVRQAARSILTVVGVATPDVPAEHGRSPATSQAAPDAAGAPAGGSGAPASGGPREQPGPTTAGTAGAAGDGRCRAFLAGKADHGVVGALAAAAGGRDRIAAYCRAWQAGGGGVHQGNGRGAPPTTTAGHGKGRGGPPPAPGGGTRPGKGDPPEPQGRDR